MASRISASFCQVLITTGNASVRRTRTVTDVPGARPSSPAIVSLSCDT
ncbi:hypothetical protein SALBM311S_03645 [Streptomyces alboniger]